MIIINTLEEYRELVGNSPALLSYFSTPHCQVCKVLKPKVLRLLSEEFHRMEAAWIDMERSPVIAGQHSIFAAPTLLVYFDGKETLRKSRNISIQELRHEIGRTYRLMFGREE